MKAKLGLPLLLVLVFGASRWPGLMPENFSAAYALAFCAGVYFPGAMAWWLPLGTLVGTDVLINTLHYDVAPLSLYQAGNYLSFAALIWLGRRFSARSSWTSLLGGGLAGAIVFYVITNTLSWLQDPVYAKTLAGWIQALTVGTPGWPHTWEFFRNSLLSGGLFTGLFAGAMKLSEAADPVDEEEEAGEAEAGDEATPEESKA
jgi:hypothetical protein